jgi:hypothetical protein
MINSIKSRTPILALILFVFAVGYTFAAKVVVVPLEEASLQQPFAVFASGNQGLSVSTPAKAVRTVILRAPADGIVVVNSTVVIRALNAGEGARCSIVSSGSADFPGMIDSTHEQIWLGGGRPSEFGQLAGTRGFNVTAGEKYYFGLICQHQGSPGAASQALDSSLTATFSPSA